MNMKITSVLLASLLIMLGIGSVSALDANTNGIPDEHEGITEYYGGYTCGAVGCHPDQMNNALASTHYLWQNSNNSRGKYNSGNTYCTRPVGSPLGAGVVYGPGPNTIPEGGMGDDIAVDVGGGCMMCHVGNGLVDIQNLGTGTFKGPAGMVLGMAGYTGGEEINVDCLICHASSNYNRLSMFTGTWMDQLYGTGGTNFSMESDPSRHPGLPGDFANNPSTCFDRTQLIMNGFNPAAANCLDNTMTYVTCTGMEDPCFYDTDHGRDFDDSMIMMDPQLSISVPVAPGFVDDYYTLKGLGSMGVDVKGCGPRIMGNEFDSSTSPQAGSIPMPMPMNNQVAIDAANSVGYLADDPISTDACLRCHAGAGGASNAKRGDLGIGNIGGVSADHDIHMAPTADGGAGLVCVECHIVPRDGTGAATMEIPGAGMDMIAGVGSIGCTGCHNDADGKPHAAINPGLDDHAEFIACQTCHIPKAGKLDQTEVVRHYMDDTLAPYGSTISMSDPVPFVFGRAPIYDDRHIDEAGVWHEGTELSAAGGFTPTYVWWNGDVDFLVPEDFLVPSIDPLDTNAIQGSKGDGKIVPVKVQETQWFLDTYGQQIPITIGAVFQGWTIESALRFGGMRSSMWGGVPIYGPNEAMPVLMIQPLVSNAALLPDTPDNIILGMAAAAPVVVDVQQAIRYGSINHEVAAAKDALDCTDCHSDTGVMDFAALGYSEPDQSFLTTLYDQSDMGDAGMTATSDVPVLPAIGLVILGGSLAALAVRRMRN